MLKFHPQSGPQLKLAVPLPFAIRLLIVKVCPVLTPGPQPGFVDALLALIVAVPVPALSNVKVTRMEVKPHPVLPTSAAVHDPANCETVTAGRALVWA
jgi:hypothetical protein